jgi:hypothetical protein
MKLSIPKIKFDTKMLSDAAVNVGKAFGGDKKLGVFIMTLPFVGWIGSEYHRAVDNKKNAEKSKLYQEAIRKHQAEIDILKTDKERESYKQRLWEEINRNAVDV